MFFRFFTSYVLVASITLLGIFCVSSASAFTITPTRQTVIIDVGKSHTVKLTVINDEKEPLEVRGSVDAFRIEERTTHPTFGVADEAKKWVKINPTTLILAPGETKDIEFTFTVPPKTSSGVHYLGLFANVSPAKGQVGVSSRIGSLLFLYVSGNITEEARLLDFSSGQKWYRQSPAQISLNIENTGTIHFTPQGKIVVRNWQDKIYKVIPINPQSNLVIPKAKWNETYDVKMTWRDTGKYQAVAEFAYGMSPQLITEKINFWYVPTGIIVGVGIIVVGIIGGGIYFIVRKVKKNRAIF